MYYSKTKNNHEPRTPYEPQNLRYCDEYRFSVRGLDAFKEIGKADSFGECKKIHNENLPADLLPYYAGIDTTGRGIGISIGVAYPCFDADIPDELMKKYKLGE
jgi:hypothetical protein